MKEILIIVALNIVVLGILIQLIPFGKNHNNPPIKSEPTDAGTAPTGVF